MTEKECSVSPSGEEFAIPGPDDYRAEYVRLQQRVDEERERGREIVVVVGLGFVGAVMAAVVAATEGWRVTYLGPNLPAEDYQVVVTDTDNVLAGYWHSLGTANVNDNSQVDPDAAEISAGSPLLRSQIR